MRGQDMPPGFMAKNSTLYVIAHFLSTQCNIG